ncbi:uncharacterized protein BJX67DRAFT_391755 [Aspergillus lucknowensis]|uniref:Hydroxyneurosporene synthase n=1 Tax=Aspergillus lucknowensis TaxID=176173 RepID=A0ABR4LZC3_9EURO
MKFTPPLALTFLIPTILAAKTTTVVVSSTPVPELSDVIWTSENTGFDAPKVSPINATTWDWWYFDATQSPTENDEQASVVVTFYTATASGFDLLAGYAAEGFTSLTLVEARVTWANGSSEAYIFNATEAVITAVDNGASGDFDEGADKASFTGAPDLSAYRVGLQSLLISGSVTIHSVAPAHYPCGPAEASKALEIAPHIGWANAIPGGNADVQLTVRGHPLEFTGVGYHDKNWGDQNFASNVGSWYWGHGRLGDYTVVWFDFLSAQRENYVSAYLSRDNEVIVSQCSGISVRPYGENDTYPPLISTGPPTGFDVKISLPEGGIFAFSAATKHIIAGGEEGFPYTRWSGTLRGDIEGEEVIGQAVLEQFNIFTE